MHIGTASLYKEIVMGLHLIGSGFRSSLKVLSNKRSNFAFRDDRGFGCLTVRTAFGKSAGMTRSFLRSSQLMSIVSLSSLLAATCRVACMLLAHTHTYVGHAFHVHAASGCMI